MVELVPPGVSPGASACSDASQTLLSSPAHLCRDLCVVEERGEAYLRRSSPAKVETKYICLSLGNEGTNMLHKFTNIPIQIGFTQPCLALNFLDTNQPEVNEEKPTEVAA